MKTEIIIPVRCEPQNILAETLENIRGISDVVTIVRDGQEALNIVPPLYHNGKINILTPWPIPRGCAQARHYAISRSTADIIVLIDGHMKFPDDWMTVIKNHHRRNKDSLACTRMQALDANFKPLDDSIQYGATLRLGLEGYCGEKTAIAMQAIHNAGVQTTSIYGACYSFRRSWYEHIGSPLAVIEQWGQDEELLSCATWIAGGHVGCLPITTGHIMSDQMQRLRPEEGKADNSIMRRSNRFATVLALPMTDDTRRKLLGYMRTQKRIVRTDDPEQAITPERHEAIRILRERLQQLAGSRSLEWMIEKGLVSWTTVEEQEAALMRKPKTQKVEPVTKRETIARTPEPIPVVEPPPPPQIIIRAAETCRMCGEENPFRKTSGPRYYESFSQAPARCCRCGAKARIRQF